MTPHLIFFKIYKCLSTALHFKMHLSTSVFIQSKQPICVRVIWTPLWFLLLAVLENSKMSVFTVQYLGNKTSLYNFRHKSPMLTFRRRLMMLYSNRRKTLVCCVNAFGKNFPVPISCFVAHILPYYQFTLSKTDA